MMHGLSSLFLLFHGATYACSDTLTLKEKVLIVSPM